MFLISGTNYMSLFDLVQETTEYLSYDSDPGLIWNPGQCLHKSQNLLRRARDV